MRNVLGLDVGNVIRRKREDGTHELVPGFMESAPFLPRFFTRVLIVSRVNSKASAERILVFLREKGIIDLLGLHREDVYFCLWREDKGPLAKALGITHFVDDHTEVLSHMHTVEHRIALGTLPDELEQFPPRDMEVCKTWAEVHKYLMESVGAPI